MDDYSKIIDEIEDTYGEDEEENVLDNIDLIDDLPEIGSTQAGKIEIVEVTTPTATPKSTRNVQNYLEGVQSITEETENLFTTSLEE